MTISLNAGEMFLCCAIAADTQWHQRALKRLWEQLGDQKAYDIAQKNKCTAIVAESLRSVLDSLPEHWAESAQKTQEKLMLFMSELDRVAQYCAQFQIDLVALKNSGIARGIFPNLAASPMGDIDVMVCEKDFYRVHDIMLQLGYQFASRSPLGEDSIESAKHSGGSEYTYQLMNGDVLWFEVQWRPVAGRWINEKQEPKSDELITRAETIADTYVKLLAPCDNLLQVCLHTAKHSYIRAPGFRLHTDVDRIVRCCVIDWERFYDLVQELQVKTVVYFSLFLAKELLHTPIPENILERLKPIWWKRKIILNMLLNAGLFNPDEPKWSRIGYLIFNLFLYDTCKMLGYSLFPSIEYMRKRHGLKSPSFLPFFYLSRMMNLLIKRAKT